MKRFLSILSLIGILALLLAACGNAEPANRWEAVKSAGKLVVGTSPDYPPFESKDATGKFEGFDVDLMNEVAKRMGVTVEWTDMPFDSLVAAVQTGKLDASISAFNYDEERAKQVDFTEAYYTAKDGFLVADTFAGTISKPEDVAAYKVGAQSGTVQADWIDANLVQAGLLPAENFLLYERVDQAALDVKAGRIDVLMGDNIPLAALAADLGGLKVAFEDTVASGEFMIILPKEEAELQAELNKAIAALQSEGFIDQLAQKWFK
ncbi:MAG TPA: ABC transporter substrate-binding protein [Anaerolineaceae bacterium]